MGNNNVVKTLSLITVGDNLIGMNNNGRGWYSNNQSNTLVSAICVLLPFTFLCLKSVEYQRTTFDNFIDSLVYGLTDKCTISLRFCRDIFKNSFPDIFASTCDVMVTVAMLMPPQLTFQILTSHILKRKRKQKMLTTSSLYFEHSADDGIISKAINLAHHATRNALTALLLNTIRKSSSTTNAWGAIPLFRNMSKTEVDYICTRHDKDLKEEGQKKRRTNNLPSQCVINRSFANGRIA
uniref:Uncharacterized protein n=1 Tax=Glossina palpalis gambiensis TaxID=67801 RepID=A0A1B0BA06_9MUSC